MECGNVPECVASVFRVQHIDDVFADLGGDMEGWRSGGVHMVVLNKLVHAGKISVQSGSGSETFNGEMEQGGNKSRGQWTAGWQLLI